MKISIIIAVVLLVMLWASASVSELCRGLPSKYGLDCSPSVPLPASDPVTGCTFGTGVPLLPCTME